MDNVTLIGISMTILSVFVYIGYKKGMDQVAPFRAPRQRALFSNVLLSAFAGLHMPFLQTDDAGVQNKGHGNGKGIVATRDIFPRQRAATRK